jgi:NADPH:quinone reductase-like Zn-dependent oxidoreductase
MLTEYAVLSEEALVRMPSHLSFEEAATLPRAAVTGWVALTGHRRVTAGDTVLTLGSGGVSVFALQSAQILGAWVIATTSDPETATLGSISVGSRADFEAMNRAIAQHQLRPVIYHVFPFAEAKEAYRHFEDRGHLGKVVIAHG